MREVCGNRKKAGYERSGAWRLSVAEPISSLFTRPSPVLRTFCGLSVHLLEKWREWTTFDKDETKGTPTATRYSPRTRRHEIVKPRACARGFTQTTKNKVSQGIQSILLDE